MRRTFSPAWLALELALAATVGCGGIADESTDPDAVGEVADARDADVPAEAEAEAGGDADGDGDGEDDARSVCGNGSVEGTEECDDGNVLNTDECLDTCRDATCGDGYAHAGFEECDDGAANSNTVPGACRLDCRAASCGDGVVDPGEACDDGNEVDTDACRNDCRLATCGDGVVQDGEACDDGNPSNTDDCLGTCVAASCGDGFVHAGVEQCDSAPTTCTSSCGTVGSRACTAACTLEATCVPPAESCNGRDDDCDSVPDDGFLCSRGVAVSCTTTCGSTGSGTCTAECRPPAGDSCTPPAESCNGLDDDCTLGVDNGFTCALGSHRSCTAGTCGSGTQGCIAGCVWGSCVFSDPVPANDRCAATGGTPIPRTDGAHVLSGSTCSAGDDFTPSGCPGAVVGGGDVVYQLVLTALKTVEITTVGTTFDALVQLGSGTTCPGTVLACDDGSAGGTPPQGRITATLAAGTYWIVVDGAGPTQRGAYTLHVTIASPVIPPNDACASAIAITPTTALQFVSGDTTLATSDNAVCTGTAWIPVGPDVWYRFELRNASAVYFSTQDGRTWDSLLQLRSGSCAGAGLACADDSCDSGNWRSQMVRILPAGTYYLAVDGLQSYSLGSFDLYYQASDCVNAIDGDVTVAGVQPLPPGGTYQLGTTVFQGNDSTGGCVSGSSTTQTAPDVYYYLGLCPGRAPTFDTCDTATEFDTVLYARYGSCWPDPLAGEVACNNDWPTGGPACAGSFGGSSSQIAFPASRSQGLYFVWVDGFNGADGAVPAEGEYGLNVSGL